MHVSYHSSLLLGSIENFLSKLCVLVIPPLGESSRGASSRRDSKTTKKFPIAHQNYFVYLCLLLVRPRAWIIFFSVLSLLETPKQYPKFSFISDFFEGTKRFPYTYQNLFCFSLASISKGSGVDKVLLGTFASGNTQTVSEIFIQVGIF